MLPLLQCIHELVHQDAYVEASRVNNAMPAGWFRELGYSKLKYVWDDAVAMGVVHVSKRGMGGSSFYVGLSSAGYTYVLQEVHGCTRTGDDDYDAVRMTVEYLK